jgi:hypothetical protein
MSRCDVSSECGRPDTDRLAILEPVVDARRRIAPDDAEPDEGPYRQDSVGIVSTGDQSVCARFAGPQLCSGRLLEHRQPTSVIGVRLRVEKHFDVLDVEAELGDARHNHTGCRRIAGVEDDVPLGPGDQEGRDVARSDVVEVASDAERFSGLLSANLCGVAPPAEKYQRNNAEDWQEDR